MTQLIIGGIVIYKKTDNDTSVTQIVDTVVNKVTNRDLEYREATAKSYCRLRLEIEQITINKYDTCIKDSINNPRQIYQAITKKDCGIWNSLALNEKSLVAEEVADMSRRIIAGYDRKKYEDAMREDLQKKIESWQIK